MVNDDTWVRSRGSHLLAITLWANPPDQELSFLAPILGVTAYDLRLKIMAAPPVILANMLSADSAKELLQRVRSRGHEALVCDQNQIKASEEMFQPRDFSFAPGILTLVANPSSPGVILACDQIAAMVKATQAVDVISDEQRKGKKFSATRTIATGGLVRSKKVKKQVHSELAERESVLYLYSRSEPEWVFLQESRLHYMGLGEYKGSTLAENFACFIRLLREQAPAALYDDSLWVRTRQTQFTSSSGASKNSTAIHSNASQNDLSAWIIILRHLQQQQSQG